MHEREILDLKNRCNSHRKEIDEITATLNELKISRDQFKKSAENMERYAHFSQDQKHVNESLNSVLDSFRQRLSDVDKFIDIQMTVRKSVKTELDFLALKNSEMTCKFDSLSINIDTILEHIYDKIDELKDASKILMANHLHDVTKMVVEPCSKSLDEAKSFSDCTKEGIEDAKKAREFADRIGVEIRILNRKFNEILQELKK